MNQLDIIYYLAAANYSCDAYGANAYNECSTTSTSTPDTSGWLAETGYNILIPLALGAAVLIASIILLIKTARRRQHGQQ